MAGQITASDVNTKIFILNENNRGALFSRLRGALFSCFRTLLFKGATSWTAHLEKLAKIFQVRRL